jgi:hypothetical protein
MDAPVKTKATKTSPSLTVLHPKPKKSRTKTPNIPIRSTNNVDWEAVRVDYEAGVLTIRATAAKHGIKSSSTIPDYAKKNGWKRDSSNSVRRRTKAGIVEQASEQALSLGLIKEKPTNKDEVIDAASAVQLHIQSKHQKILAGTFEEAAKLLDSLKNYNRNRIFLDSSGNALEGRERREAKAAQTRTVLNELNKLVVLESKLIPLEREAHGLDLDETGQQDAIPLAERLKQYRNDDSSPNPLPEPIKEATGSSLTNFPSKGKGSVSPINRLDGPINLVDQPPRKLN